MHRGPTHVSARISFPLGLTSLGKYRCASSMISLPSRSLASSSPPGWQLCSLFRSRWDLKNGQSTSAELIPVVFGPVVGQREKSNPFYFLTSPGAKQETGQRLLWVLDVSGSRCFSLSICSGTGELCSSIVQKPKSWQLLTLFFSSGCPSQCDICYADKWKLCCCPNTIFNIIPNLFSVCLQANEPITIDAFLVRVDFTGTIHSGARRTRF